MNYADLRGAFLHRARLVGTHLCLWRADLGGAYLNGANLAGADFTGANLAGAHVTAEQLSVALFDEATILPQSLREDPWVSARLADCTALDPPRQCPAPTPKPVS